MRAFFDTRRHPQLVWAGLALIAAALVALPWVLAGIGTAWVRITNLAVLYCFLALGLNIVVGFAGLLDLGYIAFYGVGAYVYALLASPQFGIHLPFWVILPIGAVIAGIFGMLLGAPTLKLRGDYLAIVTLGFGEIVRIFLNNLSYPVNITNGPQGINGLDPLVIFGWDLSRSLGLGGFQLNSLDLYYYFFLLCVAGAVVFIHRLQVSRIGRAWAAMREIG